MIIIAARPAAAHGDEIFGEVEVARVAGDAVKPDEAHFDDFMSGPEMQLVGTGAEGLAQEIGLLERDVEQIGFAGGLVMGGGGLEQMARVVKFVTESGVVHPPVGAGPGMRMFGINGAGGVKIAVRFLRGGQQGDERVEVGRHFGVGVNRQRIGSAFEDLVRIGVVERKSRRFAVLDVFAAQHGGRAFEIVHAPGRLALSKSIGNGDGAVGFEAGRPESIVQVNGGERRGLDGVIRRRRRPPAN